MATFTDIKFTCVDDNKIKCNVACPHRCEYRKSAFATENENDLNLCTNSEAPKPEKGLFRARICLTKEQEG